MNNKKLYALDLDGTLWVGDEILPDALELVEYLQEKYQVVFFSNTSSKTSLQVFDKLNSMGFDATLDTVYTSSTSTVDYLLDYEFKDVYVIGSQYFKKAINSAGIHIESCEDTKNLVVGMTTDFDYSDIEMALRVLSKGGFFIACNEDENFPVEDGMLAPGCGALVGAVVGATGRKPDFVVGKPNTYMLEQIAKKFNVTKKEIVVIGDSYKSDIAMANKFGCDSFLIGKFTDDLTIPVFASPEDILNYLQENE